MRSNPRYTAMSMTLVDGTCLVYLRIGLLIVNHYLRGEIGLINFKSGAAGCEL